MASCLSDPAPHRGDHSRSVSTINAKSALVVRQIPRASIGGPEKSSVDCGQNRPKCLFGLRNPRRCGLQRDGETVFRPACHRDALARDAPGALLTRFLAL